MKTYLALALFLSMIGCVTIPLSKSELRAKAEYRDQFIIDGNYQKILRCWDRKAKKESYGTSVDRTQITVYSELEEAEISMGGSSGLYSAIVIFKQNNRKVEVEGFATGHLGEKYFKDWMSLIRTCADSSI